MEENVCQYCPFPPGHFYSPVPSLDEVCEREDIIFAAPDKLQGINLNRAGQVALFEAMSPYYAEQPFRTEKTDGLRFYFDNPNFKWGEAIILYCLMRHAQPKRLIEIGCGYSSCAILDINEHIFNNSIETIFCEPYPDLLLSLLNEGDREPIQIVPQPIQWIDKSLFSQLQENDILLVDSTHVCKTGSDVNHIFFEVLPSLASGVYIHFHDIYYPFEYPKEWVYQRRAWNEAYLLRAFLQFNFAFEIAFHNQYFNLFETQRLQNKMPLCAMHAGSSLWLRKL